MSKRNEVITREARKAAAIQTLSDKSPAFAALAGPIASYMRKITDAHPAKEELPGHFTGVIVRKGKITDVVASNGAVKIEE